MFSDLKISGSFDRRFIPFLDNAFMLSLFFFDQLATFDDFFTEGGLKTIRFVFQEAELPKNGRHPF